MEPEFEQRFGHCPITGEAVQHPAHFTCALILKKTNGVIGRVARMNDQWFARAARGCDMTPEALSLRLPALFAGTEVIEPGLADCDHTGRVSQP